MKYIEINEHRADELIRCGAEIFVKVYDDCNVLYYQSIIGGYKEYTHTFEDARAALIMKLPKELDNIPLTLRYYEIWDN